jgi:lambda family phage portal protein
MFPQLSRLEASANFGYDYNYSYGGSKWPFGLASSGSAPVLDHFTLRANARAAYHESTAARSVVERYADSVVDQGLRLEATPHASILGVQADAAESWARDVEERFDVWAKDRRVHRRGLMNFYQLQRLAEISQQRDGEYFARFFYSRERKLQNPLQLDFVDPTQIRGDALTAATGENTIDDGIIRDAAGREVGYKIWVLVSGRFTEREIPAVGARSGLRLMVHGYQPEYSYQRRGFSRLSHALQEFENLTDFTSAQIKKAIIQSCLNMYVKPSKDAPASFPFDELARGGAGPTAEQVPTPAVGDGASSITSQVNYIELPEATMTTPGSVGMFNLREGEDIQPFKATAPAEQYERFVNAFVGSLSASMSIPPEVLFMKFGQNYSASRAALIMFWRVATIWRDELASDFLNPVYEAWLTGEIAAGRISAPGWNNPVMRAAWLSNNWIGAPMPNIDPARQAEADRNYAEIGATTLDRVSRNLNGSSGAANRQKLAREFEELPSPAPWKQKEVVGNG